MVQIIITQELQVCKNDINATMVPWRQLATSVPDEEMPTATAREEIPTVPPPAPPPEEHVPEIRGHSTSGGGDVAAKMEMVICDPFYADPAKTKVIDTSVTQTFLEHLLNEDGKLIDTGQIIIAQKL